MAKYASPKLVNRTGMALKYTLYDFVLPIGNDETLDRDKSMVLQPEVRVDPERSIKYVFSCLEVPQGRPQIKTLTIYYRDLEPAKIIYIRCSTSEVGEGEQRIQETKLTKDIIPRGERMVKNLVLGNKSGSRVWVYEKLGNKPDKKKRLSDLARLGILEKSQVVKIKYYNHDSRNTQTSYEVFVWNEDSQPPPPSAKECGWEALFGISRGKKFASFKYPENHGVRISTSSPLELEIAYAPKKLFRFSWRRALLF